jgi:polysaccharide biosynthesis protein PslG
MNCERSNLLRPVLRGSLLAVIVAAALFAGALPAAAAGKDDTVGINAVALSMINKGGAAQANKLLDVMNDSGAGWARFGASWNQIEPQQGNFQWDKLDSVVNALRQRNINVLLVPTRTPCWARADSSGPCVTEATKQRRVGSDLPDRAAWQKFLTALVTHFRGRVGYFEIWNEPNAAANVLVKGAESNSRELLAAYRDNILVPAADAIHAADPSARVVAPAFGMLGLDTPDEFGSALSVVLANGAAKKIDAVSFHAYASRDLFGCADAAHAAMRDAGIGNRPLWLTEFGMTADGGLHIVNGIMLDRQAKFLTGFLQRNRSAHAYDKVFWYALADNDVFGSTWQAGKRYGLVNNDLTTRPVFDALRQFTHGH